MKTKTLLSRKTAILIAAVFAASSPLAACAQGYQGKRDPQKMFERADLNNDGVITKDELRTSRANTAQKLDRNGDGVIDKADAPKMRRFKQKFEENRKDLAQGFDLDQNGVVTVDEFVNGPTTAFDRIDANGDGAVTQEELNAAQVAFETARGQ